MQKGLLLLLLSSSLLMANSLFVEDSGGSFYEEGRFYKPTSNETPNTLTLTNKTYSGFMTFVADKVYLGQNIKSNNSILIVAKELHTQEGFTTDGVVGEMMLLLEAE